MTDDRSNSTDTSDAPDAFDPSDHTVAEVNEYLASADPDEVERVLAAEKKGKGRKSVQVTRTAALRRGDAGEDVAHLQGLLTEAGFPPAQAFDRDGVASGEFDYHTERALRKFQYRRRLPVTGEADTATMAALGG